MTNLTANTSKKRAQILLCLILPFGATALGYAQQSTNDWLSPYSMRMPFRGDSVPPGHYIRSSGHLDYGPGGVYAIDFNAARYDSTNSQWSSSVSEVEDPLGLNGEQVANEEKLIFGAQLFAPEDGEVIACWRNAPERPSPDVGYDHDGDGIFNDRTFSPRGTGNALYIRNSAGTHILNLAHLEFDSIPADLCPHATTDDWPSSAFSGCNAPIVFTDGIPRDLLLDSPVPVKAGEPIGRVGNSGRSDGPHLHMGVKPFFVESDGDICQAAGVEILFAEAWDQPYDEFTDVGEWGSLKEEINFSQEHLFWPDPISPRSNSNRLESASKIELAVKSGQSNVAYRTSAGALKVALFNNSDLSVVDTESIDNISVFAAAAGPANTVVTAVRDSNGRLTVIGWAGGGNQLHRGATYRGGTFGGFLEAAPSQRGAYVAYQRNNSSIGVAEFEVGNDASVSLEGIATRNTTITDIAITDIREGRFTTDAANASSFDGAVTIDRRASDGEAIVRTWSHANGVQYVSGELAGYTLSANSSLSISRVHGSGREFVVATGRDTAGNLRIQTWAVSVTGELGLMAEEVLNGVSDVSVVGATTRDFVTAVIGGGKARLISWSHSNGRKLRRKGTVVATGGGAISELDIGARMVAGNLFAAVRDSDGELALLQHKVNFDPAF